MRGITANHPSHGWQPCRILRDKKLLVDLAVCERTFLRPECLVSALVLDFLDTCRLQIRDEALIDFNRYIW